MKYLFYILSLIAATAKGQDAQKLKGALEMFTGVACSESYYHQYQNIFHANVQDSVLTILMPALPSNDECITFLEIDHQRDTIFIPVQAKVETGRGNPTKLSLTPVQTTLPLSRESPKFRDENSISIKNGPSIFIGEEIRDFDRNPAWTGQFFPGNFYPKPSYQVENITFKYFSVMEIGHDRDNIVVDSIARVFAGAVLQDDREAVASLISFPLRAHDKKIKTKKAFLNKYDKIFTTKIKKEIESAVKDGVWQHEGDWALGAGLIWFSGSWNDWKIETINN